MRRKLVLTAVLVFFGFAVISATVSFLVSVSLVRSDMTAYHHNELQMLVDQLEEQDDRIRERMVILSAGDRLPRLVRACLDAGTQYLQQERLAELEAHLGLLLYLNPELETIVLCTSDALITRLAGSGIVIERTDIAVNPDAVQVASRLAVIDAAVRPERVIPVSKNDGLSMFVVRRSLLPFSQTDSCMVLFDPQGAVLEQSGAFPAGIANLPASLRKVPKGECRSVIEGHTLYTAERTGKGYLYILRSSIETIDDRILRSGVRMIAAILVITLFYAFFCRLYSARLIKPLTEMSRLFEKVGSFEDTAGIDNYSLRFRGETGMHRRVFRYYRTAIFPLLLIIAFSFFSFLQITGMNRRQSEDRLLGTLSESLQRTFAAFEVYTKFLSLSEDVQAMMARHSGGEYIDTGNDLFDEFSGILVRGGIFATGVLAVNLYDINKKVVYDGESIAGWEREPQAWPAGRGFDRTGVIAEAHPEPSDPIRFVSRVLYLPETETESMMRSFARIGFLEVVVANFIPGKLSLIGDDYAADFHFVGPNDPDPPQSTGYPHRVYPVTNTDIRFTLGILYKGSLPDRIQIILLNLIIILLQIILVLVISRIMEGMILTPLARLDRYIRDREEGLEQEFDSRSSDNEFVHLAQSFNGMMDRLQRLSAELREQEVQTHRSDLIALQAQINPHFLNNIIASILLLLHNGKTDDAMRMLAATGRHFHGKIFGRHRLIPLSREIGHLRNYIEIQNFRFEGRISMTVDTALSLDTLFIPRLLLQPLVENSITHGMRETGPLKIAISLEQDGGTVGIAVSDNGKGIEAEALTSLRRSLAEDSSESHYGLANVSERLRLISSVAFLFEIESEAGKYTRVRMNLPVLRADDG